MFIDIKNINILEKFNICIIQYIRNIETDTEFNKIHIKVQKVYASDKFEYAVHNCQHKFKKKATSIISFIYYIGGYSGVEIDHK